MNTESTIPSGKSLIVTDTLEPENAAKFQLIPNENDDEKCALLYRYFPVSYWLPRYQWKKYLFDDVLGGVTGGIMLIPQGMGYALIATLQPVYGLYASMFGPLLYSFFGTSGQLSVAPVAIVSLLTGEAIDAQLTTMEGLTADEENGYKVAISCAIAFQVGIIQLVLGGLRGGAIANLLSHSIILGFACGASILIGLSQIKYIFKIKMVSGEAVAMTISFFENIHNFHWQTFILSICCMMFLLFLKWWRTTKRDLCFKQHVQLIPGQLIVLIITTLFVTATDNKGKFATIGSLDNGLPSFRNFFSHLPKLGVFWNLWVSSGIISLVGFIESFAVSSKYAELHGYQIDASQELVGNGVPNLIGSFFQILPVTGGLSRTAVVDAAGGKTPLNSLICGIFMIFALSILLKLFKNLPLAALASIIIISVTALFDIGGMIKLYHINRKDFIVALATFLITIFLGVENGVGVGVILSVLVFIQRATIPHYAILGKLKFDENDAQNLVLNRNDNNNNNMIYRNIKNYDNAQTRDDMIIFRWDSSLFFGNIGIFKSRINISINKFLMKRHEKHINDESVWCVVLCFSGINDVDASAVHGLHGFIDECHKRYKSGHILITNLYKPVRTALDNGHLIQLIGEQYIFYEIYEAELWWDSYINGTDE